MAILIEPPQNELSALQNLSDSAGFLKKLGDGNYSIDNNNYLPLSGGTVRNELSVQSDATGASTTSTFSAFGIDLGQSAILSFEYSFIDFHSGGALVDFDARIQCTGGYGNGENKGGSLEFLASNLSFITGDPYTPKTMTIDGNGSVTIDGTYLGNGSGLTSLNASNISTGTLNAARLPDSGVTAGTYNNSATQVRPFSIDVKGRITSIGIPVNITPPWSAITGKPTTLNGYGITNGQPLGNELTAIQALSDTPGFLKKTGDGSYSIDSNTYLPTSNEVNKYISTFRKTGATNPAINLEDGEITIPNYSSLTISPPLTANTVAVLGNVGFSIGGASLTGFSNNSSEMALSLAGYSGKTTATENAVVMFSAAKHSGTTNAVALASNDIAFDFTNNFTTIVRIFGNGNINASGRVTATSFFVGTNQVVSSRKSGWTAPTGTATRTTFATSTVTLPQLAERVKALIDDLMSHGLIGA